MATTVTAELFAWTVLLAGGLLLLVVLTLVLRRLGIDDDWPG